MSRLLVFSVMLLMSQLVMGQRGKDHPKVMIIPFDPDMYFSDADQDLAKYNQKNIKEIRSMFRYGLNMNLNARVLSEYSTKPLLTDTAKDASKDLHMIYKSISYYKEKTKPDPNAPKKKESLLGKVFDKTNKDKEKDGGQHTNKLTEVDKDGLRTYMNVKIYDVKMLEYLHQKYGTEVFLFLNQFNMVTDFAKCLDRSTNTFERELAVHYSVFDYTGKQLAGDVAIVKFPSNSNNMDEIIKSNFPTISKYITSTLPGHVKKQDEMPQANDNKSLIKQ